MDGTYVRPALQEGQSLHKGGGLREEIIGGYGRIECVRPIGHVNSGSKPRSTLRSSKDKIGVPKSTFDFQNRRSIEIVKSLNFKKLLLMNNTASTIITWVWHITICKN